jgi:hypothetical protein
MYLKKLLLKVQRKFMKKHARKKIIYGGEW